MKKLVSLILTATLVMMPIANECTVKALGENNQSVQTIRVCDIGDIGDDIIDISNKINKKANEIFESFKKVVDKYTTEYIVMPEKKNIPKNKTWTVTFNKELNSSAIEKDSVLVIDEKDNKVSISLKVDSKNKKKLMVIPPKAGYKEGKTYALIVRKGIQGKEILKRMKLKEEVVMYFTIKGDGEDTTEEDPDAIFKQKDIEKYLTTRYVEVEDGIVYFNEKNINENPYKHYRPESETIDNDKLNTILYNLLKSRIEENERENLTSTGYLRDVGDEYTKPYSYVYVDLKNSSKYVYSRLLYGFTFQEKGFLEDSNPYKAPIWLYLRGLVSDDWDKWPCEEYYVERLRKDLKVIFGDVGSEICDYIIEEYKFNTTVLDPFTHKKDFEDITVYAVLPEYKKLTFYFIPNTEGTEKDGDNR